MRQQSLAGKAEVIKGQVVDLFHLARYMCDECGAQVERKANKAEEGLAVCDFCGDPDPIVAYPCGDFHTLTLAVGATPAESRFIEEPWSSFGEWAACAPCAKFIDANDQLGLTARAVEGHIGRNEPDADRKRRFLLDSMGQLHRLFFRHRIKERR